MNWVTEPRRRLSRRQILKGSGLFLVAVVSGLFGRSAVAQQKVAQSMVHYQTHPKDGHDCAGCTNFVPPRACRVVIGKVDPRGWCELWVPKSA
jgi:anaerobic selenocysteine-containing dehydrogenase